MKFIVSVATLASLAAATPQAETPLDVKLEMAGNSAVRAVITNNGKTNLKIFKTGTLLDTAAIQKAQITREDGKKVDFHGVRQRITTQNLDEAAFEHIPAGKSVDVVFNVGQVHDLSPGGNINIQSSGVMHFANQDNNQLAGSVPYTSNTIHTEIDGPKAASVLESFRVNNMKRATVDSDCSGSRASAASAALDNCFKIAGLAQSAAQSNDDKVMEYFKDTSAGTKSIIASVFEKVANECGTAGSSTYYCSDLNNSCSEGVVAYTMPFAGREVYCDYYFGLPAVTSKCHGQDQATTTLHEMTHLNSVALTSDNAYGYDNIMNLDTASALDNAESFSLFANAIVVGC
ncbi:hypothetical protein E4U21_004913 [Claviceps maximensis]|nr:hypothetical protein E4U21_004913 [Claviceps maximensis]